MDQLILSLLTIAVNALITYFLLNRQANRYEKSMEEFKSSLQLNNFEEQTRFSKSYTRRLETLENIYQKFAAFSSEFSQRLTDIKAIKISRKSYELMEPQSEKLEIDEKYSDLARYFQENSLFLSKQIRQEVFKIISAAGLTKGVVALIWGRIKKQDLESVPTELLRFLPHIELDEDFGSTDMTDTIALIDILSFELTRYSHKLDEIYKAEAGR